MPAYKYNASAGPRGLLQYALQPAIHQSLPIVLAPGRAEGGRALFLCKLQGSAGL